MNNKFLTIYFITVAVTVGALVFANLFALQIIQDKNHKLRECELERVKVGEFYGCAQFPIPDCNGPGCKDPK